MREAKCTVEQNAHATRRILAIDHAREQSKYCRDAYRARTVRAERDPAPLPPRAPRARVSCVVATKTLYVY